VDRSLTRFSISFPSCSIPRHLSKQNVTARLLDAKNCDGDAMVVRNSNIVNIDAGRYDE